MDYRLGKTNKYLKNWAKDIKDTSKTQKIFNHRSKMNGLSTSAKWTMDLEKQISV